MALNKKPTQTEKVLDIAEKAFYYALLVSFLLHLTLTIFVNVVEPPPPPTAEDYAKWVKKVVVPKVEEEKPVEVPKEEPQVKEPEPQVAQEEEEMAPSEPSSAPQPSSGPSRPRSSAESAQKRAQIREQLGSSGVLGVIGAAGEGDDGELANVFSSDNAIKENIGDALKEAKGGGFGKAAAGEKIGKRDGKAGPGGSSDGLRMADIGEVGVAGAGGAVKAGGKRQGDVPKPKVQATNAEVVAGQINVQALAKAIERRQSAFQKCYEQELKTSPDLKGKLTFEIVIDSTGKVQEFKAIEYTIQSARVLDCIRGILMRLTLPPAEGGFVAARRTLIFTPGM